MGPIEKLIRKARNLIRTHGWCQFAFARDKNGKEIYARDNATAFCSIGALDCANTGMKRELYEKSRRLFKEIVGESYITWNDAPERKKAHVLKALGQAAELAHERGI